MKLFPFMNLITVPLKKFFQFIFVLNILTFKKSITEIKISQPTPIEINKLEFVDPSLRQGPYT